MSKMPVPPTATRRGRRGALTCVKAMNATTGIATDPNRPIGSRTKILTSSHVNRSSASIDRISIADRVAGQSQKDIFEIREHGLELLDMHAVRRQSLNHTRHQLRVPAPHSVAAALTRDVFGARTPP